MTVPPTHFTPPIRHVALPKIRFHLLSHTSTPLLLASDMRRRIVQECLGHADNAIALNRSSPVNPDMQRMTANLLDATSRGAKARYLLVSRCYR